MEDLYFYFSAMAKRFVLNHIKKYLDRCYSCDYLSGHVDGILKLNHNTKSQNRTVTYASNCF